MSTPPELVVSQAREVIGAEVLVIDKDASVRDGMRSLFAGGDVNVTTIGDPAEAWALIDQHFFSVVVIDLDTPHPGAGVATAEALALASPTSAVVMLTPRRSFEDAVAAVRAGAIDVIVKSPDAVGYLRDRIKVAASRSLARRRMRATLGEVRDFHEEFLRRFIDAERRAHDQGAKLAGQSTPSPLRAELTVLVAAVDVTLVDALRAANPRGYRFVAAHSGGEALDRAGSEELHIALVSEELGDLPASMIVRSLKGGHPDSLVVAFTGPRAGAKVEIVEGERRIPVINNFTGIELLASQLDDLADALRVRERERRFLQTFRERHAELLRRLAKLKQRLDAE